MNNDVLLIQQFAQERNPAIFAEIVKRYSGFVYSICHRILGNQDRAEDASQETFLRLLQKPESVTKSISGWLHRVATQIAIDIVRQDSARQKRESYYMSKMSLEESKWKEISPYIDESLEELPEKTKLLLIQHFLEGKTQTQLAAEFRLSQPTISRKLHKGIKELRKILRKKGIVVKLAVLWKIIENNFVEATPVTLLKELGKMSMISGEKITKSFSTNQSTFTRIRIKKLTPIIISVLTITGIMIPAKIIDIERKMGATREILKPKNNLKDIENKIKISEDKLKKLSQIAQPLKVREKILDKSRKPAKKQTQVALDLNKFEKLSVKTTAVEVEKVTHIEKELSTKDTLKEDVIVLPRSELKSVRVGIFTTMGAVEPKTDVKISGTLADRRLIKTPFPPLPKWVQKRKLPAYIKVKVTVGPNGRTKGITPVTTTGYSQWDNEIIEWIKKKWEWKSMPGVTSSGYIEFRFKL
jgi:RNA polymerase sigma-70 factor (ECF subfamily)